MILTHYQTHEVFKDECPIAIVKTEKIRWKLLYLSLFGSVISLLYILEGIGVDMIRIYIYACSVIRVPNLHHGRVKLADLERQEKRRE